MLLSFPIQALGSESSYFIVLYDVSELSEPGAGVGDLICHRCYDVFEFSDPASGSEIKIFDVPDTLSFLDTAFG